MPQAIGIDLGTTNSVVAYSQESQPHVLPALSGEFLMPSVVGYQHVQVGDDKLLVGRAAVNNAVRAPKETIFSVKRLMGRAFDDPQVAQVKQYFAYPVFRANHRNNPGVHVKLGEDLFSPEDISALVLGSLKEAAETALGESVTHAVITVPAYFEERQRAATRAAAEKAGLVVKKIVDEPTAAAVAFGASQPGSRKRVLVYDLGGGTFDVSIIQWVGDQYQVIAIAGDNWLGGDDFDRQIVERINTSIRDEYGFDPISDARYLMLARRHAEEAKIALSRLEKYELVVPGITRTRDGRLIDLDLVISRDEFNHLITPYVDRTMDLLQELIRSQNLGPADFDEVLLVGGSTAIPLVHASVMEMFGAERVRRHIDPMHCVALGAAILAEALRGTECHACGQLNYVDSHECQFCHQALVETKPTGSIALTEVTARSLGIGCKDDVYAVIIPKGAAYPLREPMTRVFSPTVDLQHSIYFPVYEGETQPASLNNLQGAINFPVEPPMPLDTSILVTFDYDRDRVLTVTVRPQGRPAFHTRLDRSRPPVTFEVALTAVDAEWARRLGQAVELALEFIEQSGDLLSEPETASIHREIGQANLALSRLDKETGQACRELLDRRVRASGLASQIFVAEKVAVHCAPPDAAELRRLAAEIRATFRADPPRAGQAAFAMTDLLSRILSEM